MASVSNINRLAQANVKIPFLSVVDALTHVVGAWDSPDYATRIEALYSQIDRTSAENTKNPQLLQHLIPLEDPINMGDVQSMVSLLLDATSRARPAATATATTHNERVVMFAAQRIFVPTLLKMGYIHDIDAVITMQARAINEAKAYFRGEGAVQPTELLHATFIRALDKVNEEVGSLNGDISVGLRKAACEGARQIEGLEPDLAKALKDRSPLPAKYNASPLASKYTKNILLRLVAPLIAHKFNQASLWVTVASIADVVITNDPKAPVVIALAKQKEERPRFNDKENKKRPNESH